MQNLPAITFYVNNLIFIILLKVYLFYLLIFIKLIIATEL